MTTQVEILGELYVLGEVFTVVRLNPELPANFTALGAAPDGSDAIVEVEMYKSDLGIELKNEDEEHPFAYKNGWMYYSKDAVGDRGWAAIAAY